MKELSQNKSIQLWLNKACGSEISIRAYKNKIKRFFDYARISPDALIAEWRKVRYEPKRAQRFIDEWTEKIEEYIYMNFQSHAPKSRMQELTVVVSFFHHNKIPVEPERQKHAFIKFHNRDLKREEIERILNHAELRDRTFFLTMLESGLRPNTLVQLRYKHIKEDFEANREPMLISLPSELLKDRVEPRWCFIGADAFKSLKEYLKPRMPLDSEDLLFLAERSDSKAEAPGPTAFTIKFSKIALKLGIAEREEKGKPKKVRLYSLRKYFSNEHKGDRVYKEFWMGHTNTRMHYISRDIERHRQEYAQGYEALRIFKTEKSESIMRLKEQLEAREHEIGELRGVIWDLKNAVSSLAKRVEATEEKWTPTREELEFIEETQKAWREEKARAKAEEKKKKD